MEIRETPHSSRTLDEKETERLEAHLERLRVLVDARPNSSSAYVTISIYDGETGRPTHSQTLYGAGRHVFCPETDLAPLPRLKKIEVTCPGRQCLTSLQGEPITLAVKIQEPEEEEQVIYRPRPPRNASIATNATLDKNPASWPTPDESTRRQDERQDAQTKKTQKGALGPQKRAQGPRTYRGRKR